MLQIIKDNIRTEHSSVYLILYGEFVQYFYIDDDEIMINWWNGSPANYRSIQNACHSKMNNIGAIYNPKLTIKNIKQYM